jgi:prevent-host-death family protein
MRTASIAELRASLSENLARVKAGEEILVTEHGRPIARIEPLSAAAPEAAKAELVRDGILRAPERTEWRAFWRLPRPEAPQGSALWLLLDERREGR